MAGFEAAQHSGGLVMETWIPSVQHEMCYRTRTGFGPNSGRYNFLLPPAKRLSFASGLTRFAPSTTQLFNYLGMASAVLSTSCAGP
jgi:hypothetical protein